VPIENCVQHSIATRRNDGVNVMKEKMYVRCPADVESFSDPRVFVCGQIAIIDEFKKTVKVQIHDPFSHLLFFEDLPKGEVEIPFNMVQRCSFFLGSVVVHKRQSCKVLSCSKDKDGYYYYYLQNEKTKAINRVCEIEIIAPFNNGRIDPAEQLKKYEFQNPCWFFGHSIVSKSMNVLDNSIYGFKCLAGSKIYLLAHQVNSIMRCLQESPCRYMLADEVGMGKTIEAISVFKIFIHDRSNRKALIVVPETLKEQWKTELFFKFYIELGQDKNNNCVVVKSISELSDIDINEQWDFVIVDEVHKYLGTDYNTIHTLSKKTTNILLLSATPVQQRQEEYLSLLRLLLPEKYDSFSAAQFKDLVDKQSSIIQKTALILDNLGDFEEEISACSDAGKDPHDSEDCRDLFDEIYDGLETICDDLDDDKLNELLGKVVFENKDLGVYSIKVICSYICSNYQIESNIIRNRRKLLESAENEERLLPKRELATVSYTLDTDKNAYEALSYDLLSNWIIDKSREGEEVIQKEVKPLLSAFFSSPWAFEEELNRSSIIKNKDYSELITATKRWRSFEDNILTNITDIINDPDKYSDSYSTRITSVLNALYDDYYDQKFVIFTNHAATFNAYKAALSNLFPPEELSFFGEGLTKDEIEVSAYRFQNEPDCRIMLCDSSGGEGRNFQCADYVLHIDLPWDANMIEQRIGRLDRLERDPARPIVHSLVVYATETFEDALFQFWNEGLKIFTQSLSGMEIIMNDINHEIISAIKSDFKFGLFDCIPHIIELAENMRLTVRKEQNFDAAGSIYKPMYNKLRHLIEYYSKNENALFANTMANWASLAGFHGSSSSDGIVTYSARSFAPRSAINALLIPPKWSDYIDLAQNTFVNRIQSEYAKSTKNADRSIRGTFIRKQAIENDYLHFFAPGDAVFDCIVNNALHSCKGHASAFAFPSRLNWMGIVYTWSIAPNLDFLLGNGVSLYSLSPYRNYLVSEQVSIPIAIRNDDQIADEQVVREYSGLIASGFSPKNVIHLGKRTRAPGFLKEVITGTSNIGWFKSEYSSESWSEIIEMSRKESHDKALEVFKRRSNIRGAREEMERTLSARVANAEYFGMTDDKTEELKRTQEVILETIKKPRLNLESAALVWMVKQV